MIELPPIIELAEASRYLQGSVEVWSTPSIAQRLQELIPWEVHTEAPSIANAEWLLAAGGGMLLDKAKLLRCQYPSVRLAALPSLWGSGAEASPIAVLNQDGKKIIHQDPKLRPDLILLQPDLAATLPKDIARYACGDAWSHALEGFFSPLGTDETRADLASVIRLMTQQPIAYSHRWFELSELACAGQAKTSVGLIHGIAHTLEGTLGWSHARLCSLFLFPVMQFNRQRSPRWKYFAEAQLDETAVLSPSRELFDPHAYAEALGALKKCWTNILRDPCSRTNSALVRPADIAFFESFQP